MEQSRGLERGQTFNSLHTDATFLTDLSWQEASDSYTTVFEINSMIQGQDKVFSCAYWIVRCMYVKVHNIQKFKKQSAYNDQSCHRFLLG